MIPSVVYGAWLSACAPAYLRFVRGLREPAAAQADVLERVLRTGAGSTLGRVLGLSRVRDVADFRKWVPLSTAGDYTPYVRAIRRGACHVLTTDSVDRLVPTAGSTAGPKLIPYTRGLRWQMQQALGAWIVDTFGRRPALMTGPAFWSVSPAMDLGDEITGPSAVPIGFDSDAAYVGRVLEPWLSRVLVAPDVLRHARPLRSYRYAILRLLLACPALRLVSVWHPSFFAVLWNDREKYFERIVRDVHDGTVSPEDPLSPDVTVGLMGRLAKNPKRAKTLARLGPEASPAAMWPRLKLVSAWADAAARGPFSDLARAFDGIELQPKGLLSTEAFVSIPFRGQHPLAVTAHFIELLDDDGEMRLAHEAEFDRAYEVVVTTAGGLYRYRTGDRVRVDGYLGRTPSVRFVGRGDHVVDQVGEKLNDAFVAAALAETWSEVTAEPPRFAMVAPEIDGKNVRYTLFVDRPIGSTTLDRFETSLRRNPHYAYARDLGQLGPLGLFLIRGDAHATYLLRRSAGRTLGDVKPTSLSAQSDWSSIFDGEHVRFG